MKPRLLFLISRFLDGGIDTILVEYLRHIPLDQYDVTLAIGMGFGELEVHKPRIPQGVKVEYLVDNTVLTRWRKQKLKGKLPVGCKLLDEAFLNPVRTAVSRSNLKRLLKDADAVIDFDATFYTSLRGVKKPVVGFYHFSIEENLKRNRRHTMRQMQGMSDYTAIALLSDVMMDEGRRLFPSLSDKFVRIYNGYDAAELRRRGEQPVTDRIEQPYFVAVQRLEETQKDVTTLLHAYASARKETLSKRMTLPDLVIVGTGRDAERLQALAKQLGVDDTVRFLGFRMDAAPYIANSIALILSSKYEGFGLVIVEAMILGRPVIATDCPTGPAEILDDGGYGILTPPGDVRALADAMSLVACDEEVRQSLARKSMERAEMFDIKISLDKLFELCQVKKM